ncbi:hypothetical protein Tcan_01341, partial [Toxocara canis]
TYTEAGTVRMVYSDRTIYVSRYKAVGIFDPNQRLRTITFQRNRLQMKCRFGNHVPQFNYRFTRLHFSKRLKLHFTKNEKHIPCIGASCDGEDALFSINGKPVNSQRFFFKECISMHYQLSHLYHRSMHSFTCI